LERWAGWSVFRFFQRWQTRRTIRKLDEFDDHLLADVGVTRCDLRWAGALPLTVNAAIALEERAWQKRRSVRGQSVCGVGLCRLLPPFDAEGEGNEKYPEDEGVAADDPDNGKRSLTGACHDK
jgi:uncharacterized protein YjiS (DUF1127 family)